MHSIHRQLMVTLLVGLGFVLTIAGTAVYFSVRRSLVSDVDATLRDALFWVRKAHFPPPNRGPAPNDSPGPPGRFKREDGRWPEFEDPASGYFFQTWVSDPALAKRSANLGAQSLPTPPELTGEEQLFFTVTGIDGRNLRAIAAGARTRERPGSFRGRGGRPPKNKLITIMVARDLAEVEQTLSKVLGGIFLTGLAVAAASAGLVIGTLRRGLRPLQRLGDEVATIDAGNLEERFSVAGMPGELRPIGKRLNDLLARLETSFDRERRFSSDIAHELRTPIAEIKMMAEVALQWPEEADRQKFRDIVEVTGKMEAMTETLLTLARWEQSGAQIRGDDVAMADLTEECWQPWEQRAAERSLDVEIGVSDSLRMHADRDMLRHILGNLIANAVEYTPEKGNVVLGTVTGDDGSYVGVSVANSVEDISEEDVGNLFDRFWRGDPARSNTGNHSGLGLSLAKACAEALRLDLTAFLDGKKLRFDLTERPA